MAATGSTTISPQKKLPSLGGLRAISIVLVVLGHLLGTARYGTGPFREIFGAFAHLGVLVFFVISGFLITTLLMQERDQTRSTDLLAFYARRALRIFPAFLFFVLCLALADCVGWISLSRADYIHALTYTVNYAPYQSWNLAHLWSLSVEEQFYLLWPIVFARLSYSQATLVAAATFVLGPIVRAVMHVTISPGPYRDLTIFPAVADAIAIGCLVALNRPWLLARPGYLRFTRSPLVFLLVVPIYAVNQYSGYTIVDFLGMPLLLLAVATVVEASTRRTSGLIGQLLNSRPMVIVGLLSYSLYLWQQPFLNRSSASPFTAFPANIVLAALCATFSYVLVERPLLRLRERFSSRGTATTMEGASTSVGQLDKLPP